jgi:lysophospholipase L1-like esterase
MIRYCLLFSMLLTSWMPAVAATGLSRENIEWLDVWLPDTNSHDLPRVLLIGDSITRGYGKQVEAALKGQAYVGRMATSKSVGDPALLQQVALILQEQKFDVIHFNNGMHGDGYSERQYQEAFPKLIATIRRYAPKARLICANTTDVRVKNNLDQVDAKTKRIAQRNAIAEAAAKKQNIPIDDLFNAVKDHPEYHVPDGVHFTEQGYDVLAAQVSGEVEKLLTPKATGADKPNPADHKETSEMTSNPYASKATDSNRTRGNVDISAASLTAHGTEGYTLTIEGNLPTPCHELRLKIPDKANAEESLRIEAWSVFDPKSMCMQALKPFSVAVEIPGKAKQAVYVNEVAAKL